ncbi:hypothetical protein [Candidatus Aeolococcus gillhamiae]
MTALRMRVTAMLALLGCLAAAAAYLFGAPVSVSLLLPAMALVSVVMISFGLRAALVATALASAAFLFVQLAAVEQPIGVDFGTGSGGLDLPAFLRGAGATWFPTVLGVAALLIILPVAGLVRHGLSGVGGAQRASQPQLQEGVPAPPVAENAVHILDVPSPAPPPVLAVPAGQASDEGYVVDAFPLSILRTAHEAGFRLVDYRLSPTTLTEPGITDRNGRETPAATRSAALVRVSLRVNPEEAAAPAVTVDRLADMVGEELGWWRDAAVVKSDEGGNVMMLLPGADDPQAHALVHRLEDTARRQFQRSLESVVLVLESAADSVEESEATDVEVQLTGRPDAARVSSPEARGGS